MFKSQFIKKPLTISLIGLFLVGTSQAGEIIYTPSSIVLSKDNMGKSGDWHAYTNPDERNKKTDQYLDRRSINFYAGNGAIGNKVFQSIPSGNSNFQPSANIQYNMLGINFNGSGFTRLYIPQNPNFDEELGESFALVKEGKGFGVLTSASTDTDRAYLANPFVPYLFQKTWGRDGQNNQDVGIKIGFDDITDSTKKFAPFMGKAATFRYEIQNLRMQKAHMGGTLGRCRFDFGIKFKCIHKDCSTNKPPGVQLRAAVINSEEDDRQGFVGSATAAESQTPYNLQPGASSGIRDSQTNSVVANNYGSAYVADPGEVPTLRNFNITISFGQFKTMLKQIAKAQIDLLEDNANLVGLSDDQKAAYWWGSSWAAKQVWYVEGLSGRMEATQNSSTTRTTCGGSFEAIKLTQN